jgi:hypothetical protein
MQARRVISTGCRAASSPHCVGRSTLVPLGCRRSGCKLDSPPLEDFAFDKFGEVSIIKI